MRYGANIFLITFYLLQTGCGKQAKIEDDKPLLKAPQIVQAKASKILLTGSNIPKVICASGVKKYRISDPETWRVKPNEFAAVATRSMGAKPSLIGVGGKEFEPPAVVPAIDNRIDAGLPEVILLKEPLIKENNPQSFSSINGVHGLHSNEISSLCQDRDGNLWIGEWWGGVSKYDGKYLSNYTVVQGLSSDEVSCLFEDTSGNLWIGTIVNGVNRFDGKEITRFSTREGLSHNVVYCMLQGKDGNMWFGTAGGLNKYDGHSFTHYSTAQGLPTNSVHSLYEDKEGNLWVGTKGGLSRFTGSTFENHTVGSSINENVTVEAIVEDDTGNLWFGSSEGLFLYDKKSLIQFTTEGGLSSNRISSLMVDFSGNLWIGTWDRGANRYDGKTFTQLGVDEGLSNEVVPAMLQDRRGNIWFATTSGVNEWHGKLFSHVIPIQQEEVECLLADRDGNLWIGSGAGHSLNKYNGKTISRYTKANGLINTTINQIIQDRHGNIWFASRGGADKFDGKFLTHYSKESGLIDDLVYCILEDSEGNLWFGTSMGLSKFDGEVFTNYSSDKIFAGNGIFSLLEDTRGNIWIATNSNGLYSFDGIAFTHYDPSNSVSHPMIIGMIEDSNKNIWLCTGRGLNKFDGKQFTWYTTDQGLSNNIVKNVLGDKQGNIWVGTINGLNRLMPGAYWETGKTPVIAPFKKYTSSEGFLGGGSYENSITQDSDGNIWIGANDRVAKYHPEGDVPDTIPPVVRLTEIAMANEKVDWHIPQKNGDSIDGLSDDLKMDRYRFTILSPWYNQPENLELSYENNNLTFKFIGISTYRAKEVRYQYFLQGFERNWSNITEKTEATYSNLPHGRYTFKVKAVNSEGYWSNNLNYTFVITPPWWSTWWAYLLYGMSVITIVWLLTWYRSRTLKAENLYLEGKVRKRTAELENSMFERYQLTKKIESQELLLKERLRISRELHDDIGSTLSSISIYSEVAKNRTERKENTAEVLSKIGNASRELIEKMSDIVWSLNPNNESFIQLQNRMIAFAAMILTSHDIVYTFSIDEHNRNIQLTGEERKNIYLIFKEALHNVVKYAKCQNVCIRLLKQDNTLILSIQDDGDGFEPSHVVVPDTRVNSELFGGNGLKNMYARANDISAQLCISSGKGKGTTILVTKPL